MVTISARSGTQFVLQTEPVISTKPRCLRVPLTWSDGWNGIGKRKRDCWRFLKRRHSFLTPMRRSPLRSGRTITLSVPDPSCGFGVGDFQTDPRMAEVVSLKQSQ